MNASQAQALQFIAKVQELGFWFEVRGTIVSLSKLFPAGNCDAYAGCETDSSILLDMIPGKGGSTWGTDGASIGGMVAMQKGEFKMNKSGVSKRFTSALVKQMNMPGKAQEFFRALSV